MPDLQTITTDVFLIPAAVIFILNLYAVLDIILGTGKMRRLNVIQPLRDDKCPMVSIIVPACNEEDTIEPALRSILELDYDPLEIIVVNDRSTDGTDEALTRIQRDYPQLIIHNITELPEGWLGKNNALHQGAKHAAGEYILFTDADILFEKSTLGRAMAFMVNEQLDHLCLIFKNIARGLLLNAMMIDAGGGLFFLFKPWKVNNQKSKKFIGVGAFNLIKKSVYFSIKGHEQIKMHPIDDLMLGKMIKHSGFKQDCLAGYDFLQVHWYESPGKMISGLMKNIFALFNFRLHFAITAIMLIFLVSILPFWGIFFASGITSLLCLFTVAIRLISAVGGARLTGTTLWTVPFSLITPYINIFIIIRGALTTIANNGIIWRGTHYPLNKLKTNTPIL